MALGDAPEIVFELGYVELNVRDTTNLESALAKLAAALPKDCGATLTLNGVPIRFALTAGPDSDLPRNHAGSGDADVS